MATCLGLYIENNLIKYAKVSKEHDKIKDNYCKENNINLLRIPYWERDNGNIEKIIPIASIIPIKAESLLILNSSDSIIINDTVIKVVNILHPHLNKY